VHVTHALDSDVGVIAVPDTVVGTFTPVRAWCQRDDARI
jgi:hypothetical protein